MLSAVAPRDHDFTGDAPASIFVAEISYGRPPRAEAGDQRGNRGSGAALAQRSAAARTAPAPGAGNFRTERLLRLGGRQLPIVEIVLQDQEPPRPGPDRQALAPRDAAAFDQGIARPSTVVSRSSRGPRARATRARGAPRSQHLLGLRAQRAVQPARQAHHHLARLVLAHQRRPPPAGPCAGPTRASFRPVARVAVSSERATPMRTSPTSSPGSRIERSV